MSTEEQKGTEDRFFMKTVSSGSNRLVAVCDQNVLNVRLNSNGVAIVAKPLFYGDELFSKKRVLAEMMKSNNGNLIGSQSVALAVAVGLVHEASVIWLDPESSEDIQDPVPHAMYVYSG